MNELKEEFKNLVENISNTTLKNTLIKDSKIIGKELENKIDKSVEILINENKNVINEINSTLNEVDQSLGKKRDEISNILSNEFKEVSKEFNINVEKSINSIGDSVNQKMSEHLCQLYTSLQHLNTEIKSLVSMSNTVRINIEKINKDIENVNSKRIQEGHATSIDNIQIAILKLKTDIEEGNKNIINYIEHKLN